MDLSRYSIQQLIKLKIKIQEEESESRTLNDSLVYNNTIRLINREIETRQEFEKLISLVA